MADKATASAFITLEGVDGAGKSTQVELLSRALEHAGYDVVRLREPGGTAISEKIREILLDPANVEMGPECELLLYEAARAQLVHQVIDPALAAGKMVVCDRFYDSTTAYQAFAAGLDLDTVRTANALAVDGTHPTMTLVYDIDPVDAARRRASRAGEDRMEAKGLAFQQKVREGFLFLANDEPDRVALIDAGQAISEVFAKTCTVLAHQGIELEDADVAWALDCVLNGGDHAD